jgi:cytochrome c-type biogenesis protein CcmE
VKPKNQRLSLLILAAVAVLGAALLAMSGLRQQASYFYAPSDVVRDDLPIGREVRLGGMVVKGSLRHAKDGVTINFKVTDGMKTVPVRFRGIAPDLFREGSGVVAEGTFQPGGLFVADNLLAKHDERYMPPQLAGAMHKTGRVK